jgi:ribosomal protein S18 acetylase RimI-like enzyme
VIALQADEDLVVFRKLKRTDRKRLKSFASKLTMETKMRWGLLDKADDIANFIMEERHGNNCKCFFQIVGELNKEIVCYGKLSILDSGIGYLEGIIVRSDLQGKSYGKALMSNLEELAEKENCPYAKLEVFKENIKSIEFYEHLGYKKRGQAWGSWFMRKYLNPQIPQKEGLIHKIKRKLNGCQ